MVIFPDHMGQYDEDDLAMERPAKRDNRLRQEIVFILQSLGPSDADTILSHVRVGSEAKVPKSVISRLLGELNAENQIYRVSRGIYSISILNDSDIPPVGDEPVTEEEAPAEPESKSNASYVGEKIDLAGVEAPELYDPVDPFGTSTGTNYPATEEQPEVVLSLNLLGDDFLTITDEDLGAFSAEEFDEMIAALRFLMRWRYRTP